MSCLKTLCCFTKGVVPITKTPQKWNKTPWLQSFVSQSPALSFWQVKGSGVVFSFPLNKAFPCWSSSHLQWSFFCLPDLRLIKKTVFANASGISPSLKWVFKRRTTAKKYSMHIPVANFHDFGSILWMERSGRVHFWQQRCALVYTSWKFHPAFVHQMNAELPKNGEINRAFCSW